MPQKQPKYHKIRVHPDYEEIVSLIKAGKSPRAIARSIRARYPGERDKHLGDILLYNFRSDEMPEFRVKPQKRKTTNHGKGDLMDDDISTRVMKLMGKSPRAPDPQKDFTDEQLMRWTGGLEGFVNWVEDITIERGERVKLQDYQVEMADVLLKHSRVAFNTGAQVGKDFMIQMFSTWFGSIYKPNSTQIVMCAVQNQSNELMRRVLALLSTSVDLFNCMNDTRLKPVPEITYKNNSRILFMTAQSLIAGLTNIDRIWINEARDIREEDVTRVSPLLGIGGGSLCVLSRPRFRRGYFWDCVSNPAFHTLNIPTEKNKYFDAKVVEDDRATLSPDLFKIEYLAQFADAGSSYFSEIAVDKCSRNDYDWQSIWAEPDYDYSVGIDWARLRDTSVMSVSGISRKDGSTKLFHQFAFSPESSASTNFEHQFTYLRLLDATYNFRWVIPESSGMGIPLAERLVTEWPKHGVVQPYENRSLQAKLALYEQAKNMIEREHTIIPRSDFKLINQLKLTQFGTTSTGQVKVETPVTDDYSDSYCLSLWPFKSPFKMGIALITRERVDPYARIRNRD